MREYKINNIAIDDNGIDLSLDTESKGIVYGASVAINSFLKALITNTTIDTITLNCIKNLYKEKSLNRMIKHINNKYDNTPNISIIDQTKFISEKQKMTVDVIHNSSPDYATSIFNREFYTTNRPPVTYTLHCASTPDMMNDYFLRLLHMPVEEYDSLICTSTSLKKVLSDKMNKMVENFNSLYNSKIEFKGRFDVIPLGIDTEFFGKLDKQAMRAKYNIPIDSFVILWFGRFSSFDKANLFPLLRVIKKLTENNPSKKLHLVMAGRDSLQTPNLPYIKQFILKNNIQDNVTIIDEHKLKDRAEIYSLADVFTSPIDNVQETYGLTPIEAMSCGIPQIVSDFDGYKDTVLHDVTGFRVPTYWCECTHDISENLYAGLSELGPDIFYSHLSMSQSIAVDNELYEHFFQILIDNPEKLKEMSENSFKIAREQYSWKKIIPLYEELWLKLIEIKANNNKENEAKKLSLFSHNYHETFKCYPTRFIDFNELITLTEYGIEFIKNKEYFPEHCKNESLVIDFKYIEELLQFIYLSNKDNMFFTFSHIKEMYKPINENVFYRSLMYLIKHGYLKLFKI